MSEPIVEPVTPEPVVPEPTPAASNWYDGMDDVAVGKIQTKGWESPADLFKSYESLESFHGVPPEQLLRIPQDGSAEAWSKVYEQLGRPQHADQYKMAVPEGMQSNDELITKAKQIAFDNGMSDSALSGLMDLYFQDKQSEFDTFNTSEAAALEEQKANLKREWGPKMDEATFIAEKAMREMGVDSDMQDIMIAGMGYDVMLKHFNKIGSLISEKNPEDPQNVSGDFAKTTEQLIYEIKLIKADVGNDTKKSAVFNSQNNSQEFIRYTELRRLLEESRNR